MSPIEKASGMLKVWPFESLLPLFVAMWKTQASGPLGARALGSQRESQALFELLNNSELVQIANQLAGGLLKLIRALKAEAEN